MKFRRLCALVLCAVWIAGSAGDAFAFIRAAQAKRRQQQQVQQAQRRQAAPRRVVRQPQARRPSAPRETLQQHLNKVRQGPSTAGSSNLRYVLPKPAEPAYASRVLKSKDASGSGSKSSSVLVR